ncbi:hypothetical protein DLAC_10490 [Tieghemostelium lacteum]|uniref:Uncharacterized protein n=1 Tax=Tieghemostelium lacteum TaxID=361077 RepID=A0A151Z4R0_TIELA|nr:hypothetical protein DLAC_10490 [Tieghemostelium lacteum]|eukprot:KYQ88907.1 hypothetical protein DLAC_10490 [Tieghemostelium lacteum]
MSDGRSKTSNLIKAREAKKNSGRPNTHVSQYVIYDSDSDDDVVDAVDIPAKPKRSASKKQPAVAAKKPKKIIIDNNKKELDVINKKMDDMINLFSKSSQPTPPIEPEPIPPIPPIQPSAVPIPTARPMKEYIKKGIKKIYIKSKKTDIDLVKKLINEAIKFNRPTLNASASSSNEIPLIRSIQDSNFKEQLLKQQQELEKQTKQKIIDLTKEKDILNKQLALPPIKQEQLALPPFKQEHPNVKTAELFHYTPPTVETARLFHHTPPVKRENNQQIPFEKLATPVKKSNEKYNALSKGVTHLANQVSNLVNIASDKLETDTKERIDVVKKRVERQIEKAGRRKEKDQYKFDTLNNQARQFEQNNHILESLATTQKDTSNITLRPKMITISGLLKRI